MRNFNCEELTIITKYCLVSCDFSMQYKNYHISFKSHREKYFDIQFSAPESLINSILGIEMKNKNNLKKIILRWVNMNEITQKQIKND